MVNFGIFWSGSWMDIGFWMDIGPWMDIGLDGHCVIWTLVNMDIVSDGHWVLDGHWNMWSFMDIGAWMDIVSWMYIETIGL